MDRRRVGNRDNWRPGNNLPHGRTSHFNNRGGWVSAAGANWTVGNRR